MMKFWLNISVWSFLYTCIVQTNFQLHNSAPKISVYCFLLDECKISREYAPELQKLHEEFSDSDLNFVGIFPNFSSKKKNIDLFKEEFGLSFELKTDYYKKLASKFKIRTLPEVIVYDHSNEKVLYKGRIDNRYISIGKRRRVIIKHELTDVLAKIKSKQEFPYQETESIGCFINLNDNL